LDQFLHFLKGKNSTFSGFNANGLEIKLQEERGATFFILTIICKMATKTLFFLGRKTGIQILVKSTLIFSGFLNVVSPNQGVQLKDRLFWAGCKIC